MAGNVSEHPRALPGGPSAGGDPFVQTLNPWRQLNRWVEERPARAGTLAGWYQQACGALAALVVVPLVMKGLPDAQAGLWFAFQGLLIFVNLADFGLSFVMARQVSYSLHAGGQAMEKTDFIPTRPGWEGVSDVYAASRKIFRAVSLAGMVAVPVIYHLIVPLGKLLPHPTLEVTTAWYLLGAATLVALQVKPHLALLDGLSRLYLTRVITGTCQLLNGALVVGVLAAGGGLRSMASGVLAVSVLQYLWVRLAVRRTAGGQLLPVSGLPPGLVRACFRVGWPMGVLNISAFLVSYVQVPMLGMLLGPELVPGFYLAQRIGQMGSLAVMQLVYPQLPLFTQELAAGNKASARHRLKRVVVIFSGLCVVVALGFWWASPLVVELWVGPGRYIDSNVLLLLAVDYFVMSTSVVWAQFVLAAGTNPFVLSTFISGLINIALVWWGVPRYGLLAVPLSSLAAGLFTNYWFTVLKGLKLYRSLPLS